MNAILPTLLLSPRQTNDTQTLWRTAISLGWRVERILGFRPPAALHSTPIAVYGEPFFAMAMTSALGSALLEPTPSWLAELPLRYRQRDIQAVTLAEAIVIPYSAFIKPAEEKSFLAQVYTSGAEIPDSETLPEDMPILVSEPVHWNVEYRCFILNRTIHTASIYLRHGELTEEDTSDENAAMREFCQKLLDDPEVQLPAAVVVDIGYIRGRGWAVVEANPTWGSGIYQCDPKRVLDVLARACILQENITPEENAWVLDR